MRGKVLAKKKAKKKTTQRAKSRSTRNSKYDLASNGIKNIKFAIECLGINHSELGRRTGKARQYVSSFLDCTDESRDKGEIPVASFEMFCTALWLHKKMEPGVIFKDPEVFRKEFLDQVIKKS